jgi:response regulator RpfG family c-di-GMP phosphodiesterase
MIAPTARANRVLLIGYDPLDESALNAELASVGCEVTAAASEDEAITVLGRHKIPIGFLDPASAALDGADTVRRVAAAEPAMALLVASTANDAELAAACLRSGALDYVRLPADGARIDHALRRARESRDAALREAREARLLREEVARLSLTLRRARAGAARFSLGALGSLVQMMEIRDPYLAGHSKRVAQLAASMAAELGRTDKEVEQVRVAGQVHDIGMLCIGDGILSKAGPLTEQEYARVRQHVVIADQLLAQLPRLERLRGFIRHHHERWDGKGYPDGLVGEAIPWGSRLIGLAEIFDALTTARPYKTPVPPDEAIDQVSRIAGTTVSPEGFDALAKIVRRGKALVFIDADGGSEFTALESGSAVGQVPGLLR